CASEARAYLLRDRRGAQPAGIARVARGPHPLFEALERRCTRLGDAMPHGEARTAELGHAGVDLDVIAVPRGHGTAGARLDERRSRTVVLGELVYLREPGRLLEHQDGRGVEPLEVARIEDDAGGVAITPLHADQPGVAQHGRRSVIMRARSPGPMTANKVGL